MPLFIRGEIRYGPTDVLQRSLRDLIDFFILTMVHSRNNDKSRPTVSAYAKTLCRAVNMIYVVHFYLFPYILIIA